MSNTATTQAALSTMGLAELQAGEAPQARCVADRYDVEAYVGRGATSHVYRARDRLDGTLVALKILRPELSTNAQAVERQAAEAVTMTLLDHPHIVGVRDMGAEADGLLYVAMDWAPASARGVVEVCALSLDTILRWGVQILWALGTAHARGIVHRDVKPDNVLISAQGEALLTDFGVALVPDADMPTERERLLGTPSFMAPEQRGQAGSVGPPADLYALGATLLSLCTGADPGQLFLDRGDEPRWRALPHALRAVLFRATRPEIGARHPSARALALELARLLPTPVLSARPALSRWLYGAEGSLPSRTTKQAPPDGASQ